MQDGCQLKRYLGAASKVIPVGAQGLDRLISGVCFGNAILYKIGCSNLRARSSHSAAMGWPKF
jgi:hypothetical protein